MAYTDIDNPELYFQAKNYTGNASTNAITLDGSENMQPDMVWLKSRSFSQNHELYDSVRGATKRLYPNGTYVEDTNSTGVTAFNSDGFTLGSSNAINKSGETFASWNWLAGGSASSNSSGDITSSVSANQTAGFSIVSYTGNGSDGATFGHGLGTTPAMVIQKRRSGSTASWVVWHKSIHDTSSNDKVIFLNLTAASASGASDAVGGVSSTLITTKGTGAVNPSGDTCIAYCFAEKKGYSKFGSYTGNGNADGTFIYTGFKPAFVMLKRTNNTAHWQMQDSKRIGFNPENERLYASDAAAEQTINFIDLLSNGFKCITTDAGANGSGDNFIFMAFAESPFVTSTGIPTTAR